MRFCGEGLLCYFEVTAALFFIFCKISTGRQKKTAITELFKLMGINNVCVAVFCYKVNKKTRPLCAKKVLDAKEYAFLQWAVGTNGV